MTGKQFTGRVRSDRVLNIPKPFIEAQDIRPGDTITISVVTHVRNGEVIYQEE